MVQAGIGRSLRRILTSSTCVMVQSRHGLGSGPSSLSCNAALSKHLKPFQILYVIEAILLGFLAVSNICYDITHKKYCKIPWISYWEFFLTLLCKISKSYLL